MGEERRHGLGGDSSGCTAIRSAIGTDDFAASAAISIACDSAGLGCDNAKVFCVLYSSSRLNPAASPRLQECGEVEGLGSKTWNLGNPVRSMTLLLPHRSTRYAIRCIVGIREMEGELGDRVETEG